jgi:hypothetical protein
MPAGVDVKLPFRIWIGVVIGCEFLARVVARGLNCLWLISSTRPPSPPRLWASACNARRRRSPILSAIAICAIVQFLDIVELHSAHAEWMFVLPDNQTSTSSNRFNGWGI